MVKNSFPFFSLSILPPLRHVNFQSILVSLGRLFRRNCRPKTQKRHGVSETLDAISGSKLFHAQLKWFATIRSQKPPLFSLYQLTFLSLSLFRSPRSISFARACTLPYTSFAIMESVCACVSIRIYLPSLLSRSPIFRDPMIKIPENKSVIKKREKKKSNRVYSKMKRLFPPSVYASTSYICGIELFYVLSCVLSRPVFHARATFLFSHSLKTIMFLPLIFQLNNYVWQPWLSAEMNGRY